MEDPIPLYLTIGVGLAYFIFVIARLSAIVFLYNRDDKDGKDTGLDSLLSTIPERFFVSLFVAEILLLFLIAFSLNLTLVQVIPHYHDIYGYVIAALTVPFIRGLARLILPERASFLIGSFTAPLLKIIDLVLYPLISLYFLILRLWARLVRSPRNPRAIAPDASLATFRRTIDTIELAEDEREMIRGIYNIRDTVVREVMVPRVNIIAAEDIAGVDELIDLVTEHGFSRVPIYHDQIDDVIGVLHAKDLFTLQREKRDIRSVLRPPYFVPETKNIRDLLDDFLTAKHQMAIVVDEYGGTAGIITLEDVLEEIVGEIHDEYDDETISWEEVRPGVYRVDAKVDVTELNEALHLNIPDDEFESLGGYLVSLAGHVPEKDEVFEENGLLLKILDSDERRVATVLMEIKGTKED